MTKQMMTAASVLAIAILFSLGCGSNGVTAGNVGEIQASPTQVAFSSVDVGTTGVETLTLTNIDDDEPLEVRAIELRAGDDGYVGELELVGVPDETVELEPGEQIVVEVEYTPSADTPANRGEIVVRNSDPDYTEQPLIVAVNTLGNDPEFFPQPPEVRFQRMQAGESSEQNLQITNIGSGPMTIYEEPTYNGGDDYRIVDTGRDYPIELLPFDSMGAQASPEDYTLDITVEYQPLGDGDDTGTIQVYSNDVDNPPAEEGERQLHEIDVRADAEAPCIEVDGRTRNLGQVPIGEVGREVITVTSCGSQTLEIDAISLDQDDTDRFGLDLGAWDQTGDGTIDNTVSLSPDESATFIVEFIPTDEGTLRTDLIISSNDSIQPQLVIDVVARGAEGSCPEAVALASIEGVPMEPSSSITVAPLDTVILDGTQSSDEDGEIVSWEWEVLEDPPGIDATLEPTSGDVQDQDQSRRQLQPLTAGPYRIALTVEDDSGFQSCEPSEVDILAIPDQNIHVELTWTNPEDPDETNDFGSDLDLHLVKMGPGQWFNMPYAIWYQNANSNEDPVWNPEDPSLDIDVTDGAGPENITMRTPDDCQWYAVGVHYFQEQFGTAYATIRIYINGDLRYQRPHFPLEETGHFWDVARIHWDEQASDATIVDVDGFYPAPPAGDDPEVTDSMVGTAFCTAEGLY